MFVNDFWKKFCKQEICFYALSQCLGLSKAEALSFSLSQLKLLKNVFWSFGFEFMFLHSPSGVMLGEREISEYALALTTAQCTNWVGALHKVNIAGRRASNIEAHCLLSSVRLSCLAHCRSQFCAAHRKSLSLHLPPAAVELVSPNVPQSLLGDALNPNKSDIYLAGSR